MDVARVLSTRRGDLSRSGTHSSEKKTGSQQPWAGPSPLEPEWKGGKRERWGAYVVIWRGGVHIYFIRRKEKKREKNEAS